MALPLEGLRMIDMTRALSGPRRSIILADIVKIEPLPDGEMDCGDIPHREATKTGAQTIWCRFKRGVGGYRATVLPENAATNSQRIG